jgi:hypothetical protein
MTTAQLFRIINQFEWTLAEKLGVTNQEARSYLRGDAIVPKAYRAKLCKMAKRFPVVPADVEWETYRRPVPTTPERDAYWRDVETMMRGCECKNW